MTSLHEQPRKKPISRKKKNGGAFVFFNKVKDALTNIQEQKTLANFEKYENNSELSLAQLFLDKSQKDRLDAIFENAVGPNVIQNAIKNSKTIDSTQNYIATSVESIPISDGNESDGNESQQLPGKLTKTIESPDFKAVVRAITEAANTFEDISVPEIKNCITEYNNEKRTQTPKQIIIRNVHLLKPYFYKCEINQKIKDLSTLRVSSSRKNNTLKSHDTFCYGYEITNKDNDSNIKLYLVMYRRSLAKVCLKMLKNLFTIKGTAKTLMYACGLAIISLAMAFVVLMTAGFYIFVCCLLLGTLLTSISREMYDSFINTRRFKYIVVMYKDNKYYDKRTVQIYIDQTVLIEDDRNSKDSTANTAGGKPQSAKVKYAGRVYTVRTEKRRKFIRVKGVKTWLAEIKGKYKKV